EDGIRDRNVTGVQTCALPIFITFQRLLRCLIITFAHLLLLWRQTFFTRRRLAVLQAITHVGLTSIPFQRLRRRLLITGCHTLLRSEERRVGTECGFGWVRCRG